MTEKPKPPNSNRPTAIVETDLLTNEKGMSIEEYANQDIAAPPNWPSNNRPATSLAGRNAL